MTWSCDDVPSALVLGRDLEVGVHRIAAIVAIVAIVAAAALAAVGRRRRRSEPSAHPTNPADAAQPPRKPRVARAAWEWQRCLLASDRCGRCDRAARRG